MKTITYNPETHAVVPIEPTEEMLEHAAGSARVYMQATGGNSPVVIYKAMLSAAPAAEEAPQQELNPQDILVEVVTKPLGGFAPVMTSGVRLTHKPTGISVEETAERSAHKNKHIAWGKLKVLVANQQPATHGEPVSDGWQLRMVYFQDGEPTMHKAVDDEPAAWKVAIQTLTGDISYLLSWTERCAHEPGRLYSIPSIPLFESPQPTPELVQAAKALVDRWNSPAWGGSVENLKHTGEYITALQSALKGST